MMTSFSRARLIVVAGEGDKLVCALERIGFADIHAIACLDRARQMCGAGLADACLVVLPRAIPDELAPWDALAPAPGRAAGVPSLLFAEVVTPDVARSARHSGYAAAMPLGVAPRRLYRLLGGLLQKARRSDGSHTDHVRRRVSVEWSDPGGDGPVDPGKLKLQ